MVQDRSEIPQGNGMQPRSINNPEASEDYRNPPFVVGFLRVTNSTTGWRLSICSLRIYLGISNSFRSLFSTLD